MAKASKQRSCPAVGGVITPAECGGGRNSRYQCPADCAYNPFAVRNYNQLLAIEDGLDARTYRWIGREDPGRDNSLIDQIGPAEGASPGHRTHATISWHLFGRKDPAGRTSAERWEQAGFPGLNNDERALFRAKMRMRIVLAEIHRVVDHQAVEAVDLLDGDGASITLVDRSLAARAARFDTLLGWAFPLPHYWRLSGTAVRLSDIGPFAPLEVVSETVRHLGGPEPVEERRRWLAEHFIRVEKTIAATANERLRRIYASMDALWGTHSMSCRHRMPNA